MRPAGLLDKNSKRVQGVIAITSEIMLGTLAQAAANENTLAARHWPERIKNAVVSAATIL